MDTLRPVMRQNHQTDPYRAGRHRGCCPGPATAAINTGGAGCPFRTGGGAVAIPQAQTQDLALVRNSGLFDADWYLARYPDVAQAGMDPLHHFLTLGTLFHRDPGPDFSTRFHIGIHGKRKLGQMNALVHHLRNPDDPGVPDLVLHAAHALARAGQVDLALRLARRHLPPELAHSIAALEANAALLRGDTAGWRQAINRYLAHHGQAPLASGTNRQMPGRQMLGRLHCVALPEVVTGPLISVLMPVWNGAKTVEIAALSILNQTWRPLELLIVDDASTDTTWPILQALAARDRRVRIRRNRRNVGPYVSKNLVLQQARGAFVTGQDADDWSHPQRFEQHMARVMASNGALPVSMPGALRMQDDGLFTYVSRARIDTSVDGLIRQAPISCLFDARFLRDKLGYWDSVRFGADTEMIRRAQHVLGRPVPELPQIGMICLDAPGSLSNDARHGTRADNGGLSPARRGYLQAITARLAALPAGAPVRQDFPAAEPAYAVAPEMRVPGADIRANLAATDT